MGQIIIDLPDRINRRYRLDDVDVKNIILESLEAVATPIKTNKAKISDEDAADIRAAKRARKGDLISWEEAKKVLAKLD